MIYNFRMNWNLYIETSVQTKWNFPTIDNYFHRILSLSIKVKEDKKWINKCNNTIPSQ